MTKQNKIPDKDLFNHLEDEALELLYKLSYKKSVSKKGIGKETIASLIENNLCEETKTKLNYVADIPVWNIWDLQELVNERQNRRVIRKMKEERRMKP